MPAVLDPIDRSARQVAGDCRPAAADVQATLRLVDRTLHIGSLLVRAAGYLALGAVAERLPFGPHLLAGVLFGDFAGWLLFLALRDLMQRPMATLASLALFSGLFATWWCRYDWPASSEYRALFSLAGFGALTGRVGQWAGGNRADAT